MSAPLPVEVIPPATKLSAVLSALFSRNVQFAALPAPVPADAFVGGARAAYVDGNGAVRAVCSLELTLAASLGAALSILPPMHLAEALKAGCLSPGLKDDFGEVMNVLSTTFRPVWGRASLAKLELAAPGKNVEAAPTAVKARADYLVTVNGYGKGRISIVAP